MKQVRVINDRFYWGKRALKNFREEKQEIEFHIVPEEPSRKKAQFNLVHMLNLIPMSTSLQFSFFFSSVTYMSDTAYDKLPNSLDTIPENLEKTRKQV